MPLAVVEVKYLIGVYADNTAIANISPKVPNKRRDQGTTSDKMIGTVIIAAAVESRIAAEIRSGSTS